MAQPLGRTRAVVPSPLGPLMLEAAGDHLCALSFDASGLEARAPDTPLLAEAARQLGAYFAGRLRRFDLPLRFACPPLSHGVYEALHAIPFGATRRFDEIAAYVAATPQAVGLAVRRNPLPIIIPGHRLVGRSGPPRRPGRGGARHRLWLLGHEGALA